MKRYTRKELAAAYLHFLNHDGSSQASQKLARVLQANRRLNEVELIVKDIEQLLFHQNKKLFLTLETAHTLSESNKKQIATIFKRKFNTDDPVIEEQLRPDLLAGFKAQALDYELDMTLKNQLKQLEM